MSQRQRQDERAQHLRFAGPGGSDDEAVRAHALLGGLLDVEDERIALLGLTDRHSKTVSFEPPRPGAVEVDVADVGQSEQVDEFSLSSGGRCRLCL